MTKVMGILNVTPDSFSDGGRFATAEAAIAQAGRMSRDGADVIDVGGESTRPGAEDIPADEEIERVVPVIERIKGLVPRISIDTRKAAVAKEALDAGATIVNDVSGGTHDPAMLPLVAGRGCEVILMHMRGTPQTMDSRTSYDDVVADVRGELAQRIVEARANGIDAKRIWTDPGLGFAKTPEQSLELLRRIAEFGPRVVVGPSRKRFVGHVTGAGVEERLAGTLGAVAWCAMQGVEMVRVHDVKEAKDVVRMIEAIRGG
jgi:dihydropteroate synthase